jgi:prenyltransferase beta subunit
MRLRYMVHEYVGMFFLNFYISKLACFPEQRLSLAYEELTFSIPMKISPRHSTARLIFKCQRPENNFVTIGRGVTDQKVIIIPPSLLRTLKCHNMTTSAKKNSIKAFLCSQV